MKIKGNTVLITGGATGIGYALASALLEAGNKVVICGRRKNKLKQAESQLPGLQTRACDITEPGAGRGLIKKMIKDHPAFNILINNAGIQQILDFEENVPVRAMEKEITTNFTAPAHLANLAIPHLRKKKESAIVNISSGLGFIPLAVVPVYCASKAALHSFSVSLRQQLKETRIKVFEIIPPMVDTELDKGSRDSRGHKDRGIPPAEVAAETMKALRGNIFEHAVGMAQTLYQAVRSNQIQFVFRQMNG